MSNKFSSPYPKKTLYNHSFFEHKLNEKNLSTGDLLKTMTNEGMARLLSTVGCLGEHVENCSNDCYECWFTFLNTKVNKNVNN